MSKFPMIAKALNSRKNIEPWLAAVFQCEHLTLLLGSGFTKAVAYQFGTNADDIACNYGGFPLNEKLEDARSVGRCDHGVCRGKY